MGQTYKVAHMLRKRRSEIAASPHGWDPQLEVKQIGDNDPGGSNDTQRIITNQKQQNKYPYYRIRIYNHSKTSKCMVMYNLPSFNGTMTRTLTLQVPKNLAA